MTTYPFYQIDAFTNRPLGGNPCAVVLDSDALDEAAMLAIAREMNLSETAFVRRSQTADFAVRYFTPAEEIPLAGHPTIATTYALVISGRLALHGDHQSFLLELKHGPITVELFNHAGQVQRIVMSQRKPQFLGQVPPAQALPAFGLSRPDLLPGAAPEVVSTGTPQLMLPLASLDALRRATLNPTRYAALRSKYGFFSPHLFCLEGATPQGRTFARHFGTPPDLMEDPFTGSASGGMGAYLWKHGLIDQRSFIAEQGHWMNRPGRGTVEVIGPRDEIDMVKVGGEAVLALRGELIL